MTAGRDSLVVGGATSRRGPGNETREDGWLLLAGLDRRTARSRAAWTCAALLVLAASLALPLAAATTTSAATGLIALHLVVGAVVIPGMARTARRPGP